VNQFVAHAELIATFERGGVRCCSQTRINVLLSGTIAIRGYCSASRNSVIVCKKTDRPSQPQGLTYLKGRPPTSGRTAIHLAMKHS
jgi:hypothetical protein